MNIFAQIIHIYAMLLPFALPVVGCYLLFIYKKENRERTEHCISYAEYWDIPVEEAREILYSKPTK